MILQKLKIQEYSPKYLSLNQSRTTFEIENTFKKKKENKQRLFLRKIDTARSQLSMLYIPRN